MSPLGSKRDDRTGGVTGEAGLARALRTNEVDAIVGDRDIMFVRLRQAELDLESSRDQLRALAAHLLLVRDRERTAVARELHDEFGQALTSLQLGLAWLSRSLPAGQRPLEAKIGLLSDTTTGLIRTVRNITGELRPGTLDELGLVKSLRAMARGFKAGGGVTCRFRTNAAAVVYDRSASVAVFRIVQAALTNVAKHSGASMVTVALMTGKGNLTVTVRDNGKGSGPKPADARNSFGIIGMRERAWAFGGTLTCEGRRGKGTTVTAQMPLSRVVAGTSRQA